jgi:hypothetical protein
LTTSTYIRERQKRRPVILEGIKQGLKHSEIAAKLGVNRWIIKRDLKILLQNGDSELKQTLELARAKKIANRHSVAQLRDERFQSMTGMTFKEKSFRNMIEFYKPELKKIIESEKQYIAIMNLPKNIRRVLKNNGIIAYGRKNLSITSDALKCLQNKEK